MRASHTRLAPPRPAMLELEIIVCVCLLAAFVLGVLCGRLMGRPTQTTMTRMGTAEPPPPPMTLPSLPTAPPPPPPASSPPTSSPTSSPPTSSPLRSEKASAGPLEPGQRIVYVASRSNVFHVSESCRALKRTNADVLRMCKFLTLRVSTPTSQPIQKRCSGELNE